MNPVIAIDGTAASGKSTVARELGARLDFVYVNTGIMYRAMTWWLMEEGVDTQNADDVARHTTDAHVEVWISAMQTLLTINGTDPVPHSRDAVVNENVSAVAAVPEVREILVERQRSLASKSALVVEGRDIGSVVFPQTPYKYYIDADPDIRAQRRRAQGEDDSIAMRDRIDSTRATAPLRIAVDARKIDSGTMGVEQIVTLILEDLSSKGLSEAERALEEATGSQV